MYSVCERVSLLDILQATDFFFIYFKNKQRGRQTNSINPRISKYFMPEYVHCYSLHYHVILCDLVESINTISL